MQKQKSYIPEVRAQYEEFPYPFRIPEDERKQFVIRLLARMDSVSHHCYGGKQAFQDFRVLAAGGGTGDSTIFWAEQLRGRGKSEVVYLDMSSASMDIAQKRAAIRKLDNVKWINDSLLNIPALNLGEFDFIDCTGVLHHLEDPDAGLKALAAALKAGGAMNIMVYGLYGRAGVYQMQDLMRLINTPEDSARRRIVNTKAALENLPPYHLLNITRKLGFALNDMANDSGIFDLFLHARDRAYKILEVHDWLERCGLEMTGEPGAQYNQMQYLPETFVKDPQLLKRIREYPLKHQQAIAEVMSNKLSMHEFYAVHKGEGERAAKTSDTALIPWPGMDPKLPLADLVPIVMKQTQDFSITLNELPGKPALSLTAGPLTCDFLRLIDGQRSIADIFAAIKAEGGAPSDRELARAFEKFFINLNRGHALYLRHPSNPPFMRVNEMQARMENMS